jgi:dihydropteroate synthase
MKLVISCSILNLIPEFYLSNVKIMFTLNCKGRLLAADQPLVMGIINVTPDSFYEGSRFGREDAIFKRAEKMIGDGVDIIDIGAQSTRPRSTLLSAEEELSRLSGVIYSLCEKFPEAFISVDTFYARVASECVAAGASLINDVSGGNMDENMIGAAGRLNIPYVCMHMKGTPQTMVREAHYENITVELLDYFIKKIETCRIAGIKDVIIDPGFGFSKTTAQNFELLRKLSVFRMFDIPLMVGLSRKSTIYKTLGITPEEALNGTTVMNTMALMNGAEILRVHDVKEARECVRLFKEYGSMS